MKLVSAAAVLLLVVASAACSGDEPITRVSGPTETTSPTPVLSPSPTPAAPVGDCPGVDPANPLHRVSGPLIGDVDGDAVPDHTYVTVDAEASPGCQAFVAVSGPASFAAPIEDWDPAAGMSSPTLNRLAQIDGRPGAEVVVNVAAGASTQFVGVWSALNGQMQRLTAEQSANGGSPSSQLFAFGGSVGHIEAVDCTGGGEVVITSAIPQGAKYQVERRFYEPVDGALSLEPAKTERPVLSAQNVNDLPEVAGSPFGTCPAS